ncbi:MAG TPA: hypothetical protein VJB59_04445 [Bdellovibrionota bacterium]|nr:hypothetical protein [Bdellovibrionota bacterium]
MAPAKKPSSKKPAVPAKPSSVPGKAKKKKVGKLSGMKLEERIAPGMIASGVVDPGLQDSVDDAQDAQEKVSSDARSSRSASSALDTGADPQERGGSFVDDSQSDGAAQAESDPGPAGIDTDHSDLDLGASGADLMSNMPEPAEPIWQKPDWVNVTADGSVHVDPPQGVTVEDGVANFPADVAASALPEGVTLSTTNGAAFIVFPPNTSIDPDAGTVTIPGDAPIAQAIPESLPSHVNPDSSITVTLPSEGIELDVENNTASIDNEVVNQLLPENMAVDTDGSLAVELPEGTEVNDDGSIDLTADQAEELSAPIPEAIADSPYVEVAEDGAVTITPPEGVEISPEDGTAEIPLDVAADVLPLPDQVELNSDGTLTVSMPENTQFDPDSNTITFQQDPASGMTLESIPPEYNAHLNLDGSVSVTLPDGVTYDSDTQSVILDDYRANQVMPNNLVITNGAAFLIFPPFTFGDAGSITIDAEHVGELTDPPPAYVLQGPDYIEATPEGEVVITPTPAMQVDAEAGTVTLPAAVVQEDFSELLPDGVSFTEQGTIQATVPEGTSYDAGDHSITFPAGTIHTDQIPPGVESEINEDGTLTATLPEGITYDSGSNTIELDNYWANEVTPPNVQITPEGEVTVVLPRDAEISDDGSISIPADQADFLEMPDPGYVTYGPEYVEANPDGSVSISPPPAVEINAEEGTATLPVSVVNADFSELLPVEATFTEQGTLEVTLPEDSSFDPETQVLTVPADSYSVQQIPEGIDATVKDDGSVAIQVPDGVTVDLQAGTVILDNYWTNELMPENVSVSPEGEVTVDLPTDTQYFGNAGITISPESADFLNNPDPDYATHGPDWIEPNSDGSVTVVPPADAQVDVEAATLTLPVATVMEEFVEVIPEGVTLNTDGSISVPVPPETVYNAQEQTLTFAPGELHVNEIPEEASPVLNDDGSITATLPDGAVFDSQTNTVTLENQLTDTVLPVNVTLSDSGQVIVDLPENTQIMPGDSANAPPVVTVPADSANLLNDNPDEITERDMKRWDSIEAKVDRWIEKWEDQMSDSKKIPDDFDKRWEALETRAENWMENHGSQPGAEGAAQRWDELDSRGYKLIEKWEASIEGHLENRLDSYEGKADKLLDHWEKQLDRWENRVESGHYGDKFDDMMDRRISEMEKRWDRMDSKVDQTLDKWSSKHDLAANRSEWQNISNRADTLFERMRELRSKVE